MSMILAATHDKYKVRELGASEVNPAEAAGGGGEGGGVVGGGGGGAGPGGKGGNSDPTRIQIESGGNVQLFMVF
jgi:hypothetical protein|tara:strand:+ start:148 stop:369 length:222 start_codon:yes stop_codon:yes gene_type:complete